MKKLFLVCACLLSGLASFAPTANAQAPKISIGIIDEDKLAQGYTKYRESIVALDKRAQELDTRLESRELLQGDVQKRFDALIVNTKRSPAEETELNKLVETGVAKRAELLGLIGKNNRSKDDDKRLDELNNITGENASTLAKLQDTLYSQIKQDQERIDMENTDRANNVIERVASEKKLTLVWRKRAVIWSAPTVDITDAVLAALNKG